MRIRGRVGRAMPQEDEEEGTDEWGREFVGIKRRLCMREKKF